MSEIVSSMKALMSQHGGIVLRQLTNTSLIPIVLMVQSLPHVPLGSCLNLSESSMARKLPGGQQVTTGILVGGRGKDCSGEKQAVTQSDQHHGC